MAMVTGPWPVSTVMAVKSVVKSSSKRWIMFFFYRYGYTSVVSIILSVGPIYDVCVIIRYLNVLCFSDCMVVNQYYVWIVLSVNADEFVFFIVPVVDVVLEDSKSVHHVRSIYTSRL